MKPPLRVGVVARLPIARAGLTGLLAATPDVAIAGQASSAEDADRLIAEASPEIVLASWDPTDAAHLIELTRAVDAAGAALVLIGDAPTAEELAHLLAAGLRGFLLSDATADDVRSALRSVARGFLVLDPLLGHQLGARQYRSPREELFLEEPLTGREHEVLELLALGLANKAIALRLQISDHTVKFHVASILGKLEAASRTEAVTRAIQRGLLAL